MNTTNTKIMTDAQTSLFVLTDEIAVGDTTIERSKHKIFYEGDPAPEPTLDAMLDEPVDPVDPVDPKPADPVDPKPADPVDPKPADPVDPAKPVDPITDDAALEAFAKDNGGASVSDAGELLDAEGKVLKTAAEVEAMLAADAVALAAAAAANPVDPAKPGDPAKPADPANPAKPISLISEYQTKMGYEFKDDQGKPKVYEDTVDGMIAYNKEVTAHETARAHQEFLDATPGLKEYHAFKQAGGEDANYFKEIQTWEGIVIDDANKTQHYDVVKKTFKARGMDDAEAATMATLIKDSGEDKLLAKAKSDLATFQVAEKENNFNKAAAERQKVIDDGKAATTYWNEIDAIIQKGDIKGLQITEADKTPFSKYNSVPVDQYGNSQAMLDEQSDSKETMLEMRYYRFKELSLASLIKNGVGTKKIQSLREKIAEASRNKISSIGNPDNPGVHDPSGESVTLDAIFPAG